MRIKTLAAIAMSGLLAAAIANAAPDTMTDNMTTTQDPMQLADNGASGNATMNSGLPSDANGTGSSNMSGTSSNNMSGTPSNNMGSGTSSASPSDEGGADTATGDDY